MKNSAKSVKSAKVSPVTATPVAVAELEVSTVETLPVELPKTETPTPVKGKDAYGFGSTSEVSYIASLLSTGKYSKVELLSAFLAKFSPDATKTGDVKAKKISFSVFLSDVKRPFGTYTSSRSLVILADEKTGKLSFDAKRADSVREAIGAGILSELRGVAKGAKRTAILKKYSLPSEG